MWIGWILASAVFLALYDLAKKASVKGNAVLPVLLVATLCGAAGYISVLGVAGGIAEALHPSAREFGLIGVKGLIVSTSWVLTYYALRTLPITIATPIRASAPALADWLYFHGLAIPDVPISVGSLMRRFSVAITFVLGALFFHETNLKRKSIALAMILAGIVLLCLR